MNFILVNFMDNSKGRMSEYYEDKSEAQSKDYFLR
jgi:hypothetical protein